MYWDDLEEDLDELEDLYLMSEDDKLRLAGRGGCLGAIICLIVAIIVLLFL